MRGDEGRRRRVVWRQYEERGVLVDGCVDMKCVVRGVGGVVARLYFFFKQKTAYEI